MAPNHLPLVVSVPESFEDDPAVTGAGTPQTITVQLNLLSGQVYHLPLSERAAQMLTLILLTWAPVRDFIIIIEKFESDDET